MVFLLLWGKAPALGPPGITGSLSSVALEAGTEVCLSRKFGLLPAGRIGIRGSKPWKESSLSPQRAFTHYSIKQVQPIPRSSDFSRENCSGLFVHLFTYNSI